MRTGLVHHVEIWVPDLDRAERTWGWLLQTLGYAPFQKWKVGRSWKLADTYIVVEESADRTGHHDRTAGGLNHLAFFAGSRRDVDSITDASAAHGWTLLFAGRVRWSVLENIVSRWGTRSTSAPSIGLPGPRRVRPRCDSTATTARGLQS